MQPRARLDDKRVWTRLPSSFCASCSRLRSAISRAVSPACAAA